ncbi:signal transduction histidine kinase [Elusimicrobium posterum]|uniref:hybrid sensor histidine kinase/response regulator n=1 Tax=Elusimicrobium posterum TaxID=3116653 RepID=UPI003C782457
MDNTAKILIVDDDNNLRETLADLLEMEGYSVYQAGNGKECLDIVATEFFNVIIMDYNLPDMTGLDIIKNIRMFNNETQILMVTAHASMNAMMQAMQESVYDFLIKPVDFDYLKRTIKRALEKFYLEQNNKLLLEQLKKNNEDLKRLDNMKSKFFSIVSHDLSNSIMTLKMSFDMLKKNSAFNEDQQKKAGFMQESIGQIEFLIRDLVDWAAIEKGKLRIEKKGFELTTLTRNTAEVFKEKGRLKNIDVTFESFGETIVYADEKRIKQVLSNLLENALRHTNEGGRVEVKISKIDEKNAKVSVKDNGDGIDPAQAPNLFDSFSQGVERGKVGRLGLGLSISKDIVTNHDGKIWAESEGLGKGATFNFSLPLEN